MNLNPKPMIISFGDKDTQRLFEDERPKKLPSTILRAAFRKLILIDAAKEINDLRSPPGNRLEKLSGDLVDFYSIRINRQWRIIFQWTDEGPENVTIVDYH